jgi:hypothetical protein
MFRRIEEVVQEIQDTRQHSHSAEELGFLDGTEGSVHGPEPPTENQEKDEALMNLRKFRRIQLIDKSLRAEMDRAMPRRSSTSSTLTEGGDLGDEFVTTNRPTVPTLIEWEGGGKSVHVTGTFAGWNRKYRLHRK